MIGQAVTVGQLEAFGIGVIVAVTVLILGAIGYSLLLDKVERIAREEAKDKINSHKEVYHNGD